MPPPTTPLSEPPPESTFMLKNRNAIETWDRDHFFHPSTAMGAHARGETPNRIIVGGEGVYVTDRDGQRSLDAFAGLYCVNIGYGRQEVAEAIAAQAKVLAYYHSYASHANEPSIILSEMILRNAPAGMSKVFYGLSGSDANDTNVKLVWHYNNLLGRPKKKKIISRIRGYHGSTVMAGSLTGLPLYHAGFDLPIPGVLFTDTPHFYWRAREGESEL